MHGFVFTSARLLLALTSALGTAGCALGVAVPRAQLQGWQAVEVGDVHMAGDLAPEAMQRFAAELALFDGAFAQLAGWPPGAGAGPVRIFLIREPALARRFGLGGALAGWALPTLDGTFCAVVVRESHSETRDTLYHEYTHVLLRHDRRAPVPPWYDEGLASFFGTLDAREGAVVVGAAPGAEVAWLVAHGPLPLEELFEGNVWERPADGVYAFYATAWGLSHYLLLTPRGRREMSTLVAQLARGVPPAQAQRAAFGRSSDALEAELRAHLGYLARGVPAEVVLDGRELAVPAVGPVAALGEADAACELGELALELAREDEGRGESALARSLLERSIADGPGPAHCEAALAEARARTGDVEAAQTALRAALASAPADARVQVRLGRAELARAGDSDAPADAEALERAERHFRRALELDDRSAAAWFGLGRSLDRAGAADPARRAFERARSFAWSPALDLALGRLELAQGQPERAFALLWPLVQDPHGGPTREAASRLLERAGLLPSAQGDARQ